EVAARSVEACDKSNLNRVEPYNEDDRNRRGRCLCGGRRGATHRGGHGHLMGDPKRPPSWEANVLVIFPAVFARGVLALDIASLFQTPTERGQEMWVRAGDSGIEESDYRHRRLLRARRERPRCRAAEQRDELAPLHLRGHSMTSSAMATSLSGIWRPSALAVLRLTTSTYLFGFCTGRSAGFSPLRMRSTYAAARR